MTDQIIDLYTASTLNVEVKVEPFYIEGESQPEDCLFVWGYKVIISNNRKTPVQLRRRYWKITNGLGSSQEVQGEGVIGQQPIIEPGASFEYTSGAPLSTPSGIMFGYYTMEDQENGMFDIHIPAFSLDCPYQKQTLN